MSLKMSNIPGVSLNCAALSVLGAKLPESYDNARLSRYMTRKLPHFQQKIKTRKRR